MALPADFLDELRARTQLAAVIGRYTKLARSGRQWKGCCPFHEEATPSFYVYEDHYHCFGCGAHGDAIGFVMQRQGLDFAAAVEQLASEAGLDVPRANTASANRQASMMVQAASSVRYSDEAKNASVFQNGQLDTILGTAARVLLLKNNMREAALLANAEIRIVLWGNDSWDGGQDTWKLYLGIPLESYLELKNREDIEKTIDYAIGIPMEAASKSDFIQCEITTNLEPDPDWRQRTRQHLSGEGITNQGRVRSDRIATREHEGLLFRSRPEVYFYQAMKSTLVPFAPLPVVIRRLATRERTEPDFLIFKDGIVMIVEIDGDTWHTETPAQAHTRLQFLLDEGAHLHRISASDCDTIDKAREAAKAVITRIGKLKSSQ